MAAGTSALPPRTARKLRHQDDALQRARECSDGAIAEGTGREAPSRHDDIDNDTATTRSQTARSASASDTAPATNSSTTTQRRSTSQAKKKQSRIDGWLKGTTRTVRGTGRVGATGDTREGRGGSADQKEGGNHSARQEDSDTDYREEDPG